MINTSFILSKLPTYTGTVEVIADDQNVYDIIRGVKSIHKRYASDYDKIAKYFIGETGEDTCRNIFNFLRRSSFYYVEGEDLQTLRSPSAILATGQVHGIDCKNYALFAGGVLDAINRSGLQEIPFCYRFASDKLFDPTPCHVFVVAYPGTKDEMWIDPIPQVSYFDERLTYYFYTDKNYKAMSLQVISGRQNSIGDLAAAGNQLLQGNWTGAAFSAIASIVSSGGPNPNNWKGWHSDGSDARYWVLNDGDSVPNEAVNILSWIQNHGMSTMLVSSAGVPAVTPAQIAAKVSRGGFPQQAQTFLNSANSGALNTGGLPAGSTTTASSNKLITFGLIGAGVIFLANQKRKVAGIDNTMLLVGGAVAAYFLLKPKSRQDLITQIQLRYPDADFTTPTAQAELAAMDLPTLQGLANGTIHGS